MRFLLVLMAWAGAASAADLRGADKDCPFGSGALGYFNLPLETQRITCRSGGVVVIESYGEWLETPYVPFHYWQGHLLRLPVVNVRVSPADNVELQVSAPAMLMSFGSDGVRRNEGGDITLGTKWTVFREHGSAPGLGLRWAVKLPNASEETGLGTDRPDTTMQMIVSKTLGRVQLDGNFGLSIIGDPWVLDRQTDIMVCGAAASVLCQEMGGHPGISGISGKRGLPTRNELRAGAVWEALGPRRSSTAPCRWAPTATLLSGASDWAWAGPAGLSR